MDYLVDECRRLQALAGCRPLTKAAISLGAALDGRSGLVWNSGPLWGPGCEVFDLQAALCAAEPGIQWQIANDISAALLWHVAQAGWPPGRTVLVTVSTGIGCRTWDGTRRCIPLDRVSGLQGEIGHLPIRFSVGGEVLERQCDCGGANHLNAFCSGSALQEVLPILARHYQNSTQFTDEQAKSLDTFACHDLAASARRSEPLAQRILEHVTYPLAEAVLWMFTLDPEIERLIFTGGVVHGLAPYFLDALQRNLETLTLYQVSTRVPDFFRERLCVGCDDDKAGMLGAVLAAQLGTLAP